MATKLDKRVDVKGHGGLSPGLALHHQSSWGDGEKIAKVTENGANEGTMGPGCCVRKVLRHFKSEGMTDSVNRCQWVDSNEE